MKRTFTDQQVDRIIATIVGVTIVLSAAYILAHAYFEVTFK